MKTYLIDRRKPANVRAFVEMYDNGECGFHWDFYDETHRAHQGPEDKFEGVFAPEALREEIKNRNWPDPMSPQLRKFADELWTQFYQQDINAGIPVE